MPGLSSRNTEHRGRGSCSASMAQILGRMWGYLETGGPGTLGDTGVRRGKSLCSMVFLEVSEEEMSEKRGDCGGSSEQEEISPVRHLETMGHYNVSHS